MRINLRIILFLVAVAMPAAIFGHEKPMGGPAAEPIQIVLYPAAEPRPALRYQLLPSFLERRPGNAAVWWNRLPAERNVFFEKFYENNGPWFRLEKWMEIPIGDPREKACREKELAKGDLHFLRPGCIYDDMERAAQFESCDWEQPIHEGGYITMLLPEIQQARSFARLLSAKAHLEIAEGKYDQAVRTLQTGYAQGRQVAQSPTIVSSLVGITIASLMSYQVQQFIQRPDAPNLYWALSALPRPLVDMRWQARRSRRYSISNFPNCATWTRKTSRPTSGGNCFEGS